MVLEQLAEQVESRLAELEIAGKTVTLKLQWHNFQLVTRSMTVASPIQDAQAMMRYLVTQRLKRLGALVLQRRSLTHLQTGREGVGLAPVSDAPQEGFPRLSLLSGGVPHIPSSFPGRGPSASRLPTCQRKRAPCPYPPCRLATPARKAPRPLAGG